MLMADVLIVVDPRNADANSLTDVALALADMGAEIQEVDTLYHTIEATLPGHEVPVVAAMCGVAYVRVVFQYERGHFPAVDVDLDPA